MIPRIDLNSFRHLETHFTEKLANQGWIGAIVTPTAEDNFAARIESHFPYKPLQAKNHAKISIDRTYSTDVPFHDFPEVVPDSPKVHYLIHIPWVPPKNGDFQSGVDRLYTILNSITEQAFDRTIQASKAEVRTRVAVVIGVNRVYSLDRNFNTQFNEFLCYANEHLEQVEGVAFRITSFLWSPWVKAKSHKPLFYPIDRAFQVIKALSPTYPEAGEVIKTYLKVNNHFKNLMTPKETLIHYQRIRDTIMHSDEMQNFFQRFAGKTTYLHTLDSDFGLLKQDHSKGLLSHYDTAITAFEVERQALPSILCTGYRASNNTHEIIRFVIDIEARVREEMSKILGSSIYYTEPNFIAHIPHGQTPRSFSFINPKHTHDAESRWFMLNGIRKGLIHPDRMRFLSEGALVTEIDEAWQNNTYITLGSIQQDTVHQSKVLKAIRGVKQSHLDPQIWATNVYIGIGCDLGANHMKGKAALKAIHDCFSPIVLAQIFNTKIRNPKRSFDLAIKHFELYTTCLTSVYLQPATLAENTALFANGEGFTPNDKATDVFGSFATKIFGAITSLRTLGAPAVNHDGNILKAIELAKATGKIVHQKLQTIDKRTVASIGLVNGAIATYTLSSWRGDEVLTEEAAHDMANAGNIAGYRASVVEGRKIIVLE